MLSDHPFEWERVRANPKGEHGVFCVRQDWFKTMSYRLLDSNGFLLLYTMRGRVYWISQNVTNHTTPDWKIHFSICEEHIPLAWNIIAQLFIDKKCEIGMKATTVSSRFCNSSQRGREITVYVYKYDTALKRGVMYETSPETGHEVYIGLPAVIDWPKIGSFQGHIEDPNTVSDFECDYYLGAEIEAPYDAKYWFDFISEAEKRLCDAGVRSNGGVADGDLPLPHCRFASLRNEAFVIEEDAPIAPQVTVFHADLGNVTIGSIRPQLQYPSNKAGWNAAKQRNPLEETIYMLLLNPPHRNL
jgi:hypothetical protein